MTSNLDELAQYIRQTIPQPRAILQLKPKPMAGGVTFIWHGVEFFVKPSLHVLEIRGHSLYITGLSTLLQTVFMKTSQSEEKFGSLLDALGQAENLVRGQNQSRAAAQVISSVRQNLQKMVGR
jgi:hypothetical protein